MIPGQRLYPEIVALLKTYGLFPATMHRIPGWATLFSFAKAGRRNSASVFTLAKWKVI